MADKIIIIGGGQAAAMAAAALRQNGYQGALTLISDEQERPYERPPLSKGALLEDNPQLQPVLPADWWQTHNVTLRLGTTVATIDHQQHRVVLDDGEALPYDRLLLATGAKARPLPELDALGDVTFTLRHAGDAARLRDQLIAGRRVIIVGAGTIGLELAATATQRQCQVTVVEMAPMVMGRNAPPPVRDWLEQQHLAHGVQFKLNNSIEHVALRDGEIDATLQNGERISGDLIIYGIGIVANDQLAQQAGLATANGIVVDTLCRTSDAAIYAAGDVTLMRQPDGSLMRRETWENANQQAQIAAAAMLDLAPPVFGPDWFWTDQYAANLQFVGNMQGDHWVVRGDISAGKAIWFNLLDGQLIGAATLNQGREIRQLRKMVQAGVRPDIQALTDSNVALKTL